MKGTTGNGLPLVRFWLGKVTDLVITSLIGKHALNLKLGSPRQDKVGTRIIGIETRGYGLDPFSDPFRGVIGRERHLTNDPHSPTIHGNALFDSGKVQNLRFRILEIVNLDSVVRLDGKG